MKSSSFKKAFVLFLPRKTSKEKGNLYSFSFCVKETNRLKDIFCCTLFVCPMLTTQKERMAKLHMLHCSLGPFHILPPWSWSTLMSKWRVPVSGPSLFRFGSFCQNYIRGFLPERSNHIISSCTPWQFQSAHSPFSLTKKPYLLKVNNFENFRHTEVWDPPDWEFCNYPSQRNGL